MPVPLTFDVTAAVGSGERLTQAAWAFLPERPPQARAIVVCLVGGTYDKHYWHLEIAGHPGYSFGEHLAAAGYIVIAVDHWAWNCLPPVTRRWSGRSAPSARTAA
jgi:alpha-beta hydrolase superfamily lysophospholipase